MCMNRLTAAGMPATAVLILLLGSCTTSSFMGLSRSSHVDAQLAEMESEIEQLRAMEKELEEALENEDRLQAAVDELKLITDDFTLKLESVAGEIRAELEGIPDETLRDLVDAIESYLESETAAESPPPVPEGTEESDDAESSG